MIREDTLKEFHETREVVKGKMGHPFNSICYSRQSYRAWGKGIGREEYTYRLGTLW
jgi:hypothetical protein